MSPAHITTTQRRQRWRAPAWVRPAIVSLLWLALNVQPCAAALPVVAPAVVGLSAERLAQINGVVQQAIERKETPGAVVLVGRRGRVAWHRAYGARAVAPVREALTTDTIFDCASLTKVVATATSIMLLVERGQVRLHDPLVRYLPEVKGDGREQITIEQLLTHRAGFAPDFDLGEQWVGYDEAIKRLATEPLRQPPGARFVYSDIGYIALGEVVRRVSGQPLDEFARTHIYAPLGMHDTGFRPAASLRARIAPTERRRAQAAYLGGRAETVAADTGAQWLRGEVHDPTAARMGGVAGHAGLFSTAADLAVFCQMILNGGTYGGARILSPLGVATMTRPRVVGADGAARGLGWDIASSFSSNRGDLFPPGSFGHTGFTGTSLWLDPTTQTFVVFLSNRVHPDGHGDVTSLRARIATIVAGAITDVDASAAQTAAARFAAEVAASALKLPSANAAAAPVNATDTQVLTGIDVLARTGFKPLAGLRVGLVTNHTGRDRAGRPTIDVLHAAPNVRLVALFAPEHGIRGQADEKVADTRDEQTGLPIYSLYGETRRPTPAQLQDLDALVFDIQDIGTRFYTYISTLGYVLEAAAQAHKPVFVLDRPNPLGGEAVEGPLAEADKLSFTAYHMLPVRHGLTVGELARLFNAERQLGCDLRVVEMQGWRRAQWFDATNLTWVNTSPNMRSLTAATLYPGVGLLEPTNLSVGRGTDTPFELIGAPWLDGAQLAAYLNERHSAGVRFVPVRFTPRASVFQGQECGGVNLIITDRARFEPVRTGIEIAVALRRLYPTDWQVDKYARLLGNADTLARVRRADAPEEIVRAWQPQLAEFQRARARVLIYR